MNAHWNSYLNRALSRRELLRASSTGFGALALAAMLGEQAHAATAGAQSPLAEKPPQFPARAKRVIFLFMHGGPSQVDTFDYKPLLIRDHGKPLPFKRPKVVSSETFNLLKSPWEFKQYGAERNVGQRFISPTGPACGRYLLHQVDVGIELQTRRCVAGIAYGQRYFCPAQHGFLDYIWIRHREPEHARLHHHLPHAESRRRK